MPLISRFAARFREMREEKGISARALSKKGCYDDAAVNHLEMCNGSRSNPTLRTIIRFGTLLGLTREQITELTLLALEDALEEEGFYDTERGN